MKRCDCGAPIALFSFYPVCVTCLHQYLGELPDRPGFSIMDFRLERRHARQAAAVQMTVPTFSPRVRLLNTVIDPLTYEQTIRKLEYFVESGVPHQIVTVNVDFVRIAQQNDTFRRILNQSALSVADGKPLLWAARWTGQEIPARITGMDLVLGAAELASRRNESLFFLGAAEGVASKAAAALQQRFPTLDIHVYSPPMGPFTDEENRRIVDRIRASGARYLFVAFGAPKQDVWIDDHMHELGVPVCAGIGGVLNFLAGAVKRAPDWVQHAGMEWMYRIVQEPARLWRRYFIDDLPVFSRMLMEPVNVHEPAPSPMEPRPTLAMHRFDSAQSIALLEPASGHS